MKVEHIGDATLYLGDCLEALEYVDEIDAVVADPPYGIPHKFSTQKRLDGSRSLSFAWDGEHVNETVFQAVNKCADLANAQFWFCGVTQVSEIAAILRAKGLTDKMAAWVKDCPPPAMPGNWWPSGFEVAVYAYRSGAWFGDLDSKRSNVFRADSYRHGQPGKEDHPTQKPLGLMGKIVAAICEPAGLVLDPFMGSGSTGVASLQAGRRFIGIEREPKYFDIAVRRITQAYAQRSLFNEDVQQVQHEQVGLGI